jgi:hypothetical protein
MTFSRIRESGQWLDESTVEDSEFEAIDENLSNAIDGAAGGAYAPSNAIEIGGAGLSLGTYPALTTVSYTVPFLAAEGMAGHINASTSDPSWDPFSEIGGFPYMVQTDESNAYLYIPISPPIGATITAVTLTVNGGGDSHAGLPAEMPVLKLVYTTGTTTVTSVDSATDSSADVSAYEVDHTISLSPNHVVVASRRYFLQLRGEHGSNTLPGALRAYGGTYTFDASDIRPHY